VVIACHGIVAIEAATSAAAMMYSCHSRPFKESKTIPQISPPRTWTIRGLTLSLGDILPPMKTLSSMPGEVARLIRVLTGKIRVGSVPSEAALRALIKESASDLVIITVGMVALVPDAWSKTSPSREEGGFSTNSSALFWPAFFLPDIMKRKSFGLCSRKALCGSQGYDKSAILLIKELKIESKYRNLPHYLLSKLLLPRHFARLRSYLRTDSRRASRGQL
jgi:hypothetical protein